MSEQEIGANEGKVVDAAQPEGARSRLDLLKAAGVAAGVVAAGRLVAPEAAGAADGSNFVLGQANTATSKTSLTTSGAISNDGAISVSAPNADWGVYGSASSYGLVGTGPGGVLGLGTVGGVFSGTSVAINLDPLSTAGSPAGQAFTGDMAVDSAGVLWLCVAAGTPGTWARVTNPPGAVVPLAAPVRVVNTTDGTGGITGPLIPGATVHTTNSLLGSNGIPSTAIGVVGNFAVSGVNGALMNGFGVATIYPAGVSTPSTANINAGSGCFAISNSVTVAFGTGGAAGKLSIVWNGGGTVLNAHAFLDVAGYF